MEIEAKYISSRQQFTKLLETTALGEYDLGTAKEQRLTDQYLDTDHRDILKAGYALRLREKNGEWSATVKGLGGAEGAIHKREEYETDIQPDMSPHQWPESHARDLIISLIGSKPLHRLFVIRQQRFLRSVHWGKRLIGNMSLDVVNIESGCQHEMSYEVEIELEKDGTLEDLQALDKIVKAHNLHPEPRSKFERAMALLNKY